MHTHPLPHILTRKADEILCSDDFIHLDRVPHLPGPDGRGGAESGGQGGRGGCGTPESGLAVRGGFAGAVTMRGMVTGPTGIGCGVVQVTTGATAEQVNPPPPALTNVRPTPRTSETGVVPTVGAVPVLVTVIV